MLIFFNLNFKLFTKGLLSFKIQFRKASHLFRFGGVRTHEQHHFRAVRLHDEGKRPSLGRHEVAPHSRKNAVVSGAVYEAHAVHSGDGPPGRSERFGFKVASRKTAPELNLKASTAGESVHGAGRLGPSSADDLLRRELTNHVARRSPDHHRQRGFGVIEEVPCDGEIGATLKAARAWRHGVDDCKGCRPCVHRDFNF